MQGFVEWGADMAAPDGLLLRVAKGQKTKARVGTKGETQLSMQAAPS